MSPDHNLIRKYNKTRNSAYRKQVCYAPYTSLLFIQSGHVMPCHYNRGTILGKIPEQSINEIWFGDKIKTLQNYISNQDLHFGCDSCLKNIRNHNFYNTGARKYDNLPPIKKYPVMLDFQISNTCNLECIMCSGEYSSSIRSGREKKPQYLNPYNDQFIDQLDEFIPHLKYAKFTGGEPFLIKEYYRIWESISRLNKNVNISVSTNGSILNDKIKSILQRLNFNFTISIDSITDDTYSQIRKKGNLKETLKNISYFIEYANEHKRSLIIKFVVIQQNWQELPDFFNYWNNQNVRLLPKMVWFPPFASLRDLSSSDLQNAIKHLDMTHFTAKSKIQKENLNHYKGILDQIKKWHKEKLEIAPNKHEPEQIIQDILANIIEFINSKDFITDKDKIIRTRKYKELLYILADSIEEVADKTNALLKFFELPVDIVVAEMERENIEKLTERFKQSCYF